MRTVDFILWVLNYQIGNRAKIGLLLFIFLFEFIAEDA